MIRPVGVYDKVSLPSPLQPPRPLPGDPSATGFSCLPPGVPCASQQGCMCVTCRHGHGDPSPARLLSHPCALALPSSADCTLVPSAHGDIVSLCLAQLRGVPLPGCTVDSLSRAPLMVAGFCQPVLGTRVECPALPQSVDGVSWLEGEWGLR